MVICLSGTAKSDCGDLIEKDYYSVVLKNESGLFGELKKKLITKLSDHPFPGDRIQTYLSMRVKYVRLKKEDGHIKEPVKVLARLQRIRKFGATMAHNQGVNYISDTQVTLIFWNIFR